MSVFRDVWYLLLGLLLVAGRRTHAATNRPPVIVHGDKFQLAQLEENTPAHQVIFKVQAYDNDKGLDGAITFSLKASLGDKLPSEMVGAVEIDLQTGVIWLKKAVDFEKLGVDKTSTTMLIRYFVNVTDQGTPPKWKRAVFLLNVRDTNDNTPMFASASTSHNVTLNETATVGTEVFTALATDADHGKFGKVSYMLEREDKDEKDKDLFVIDPQTGTIVLNRTFRNNVKRVHDLLIIAKDGGSPPRKSVARLRVAYSPSSTDVRTEPPTTVDMSNQPGNDLNVPQTTSSIPTHAFNTLSIRQTFSPKTSQSIFQRTTVNDPVAFTPSQQSTVAASPSQSGIDITVVLGSGAAITVMVVLAMFYCCCMACKARRKPMQDGAVKMPASILCEKIPRGEKQVANNISQRYVTDCYPQETQTRTVPLSSHTVNMTDCKQMDLQQPLHGAGMKSLQQLVTEADMETCSQDVEVQSTVTNLTDVSLIEVTNLSLLGSSPLPGLHEHYQTALQANPKVYLSDYSGLLSTMQRSQAKPVHCGQHISISASAKDFQSNSRHLKASQPVVYYQWRRNCSQNSSAAPQSSHKQHQGESKNHQTHSTLV